MIIPVTAIFASVLAILVVALGFRISLFRRKHALSLGVNDDPDFVAAVRAHANLIEYAPIALILLAIGEINGLSPVVVYGVGMVFVVGRLLHAWGMITSHGGPHKGRIVGILMSWFAILVMAVLVVWNVIQVNG